MRTLLILSFLITFRSPAMEIASPLDKVGTWIAKIEWTDIDSYYGTAVAFHAWADRLYYVTNAHILPKDNSTWDTLRLSLPHNHFKKELIRVERIAPSLDIAVISTERPADMSAEELNSVLECLWNTSDLKEPMHIGVIGTPGFTSSEKPFFRSALWESEGPALAHWASDPTLQNADGLFKLSDSTVALEHSQICPPLFLFHCLIAPIRTWGYSGGALVVGADRGGRDASIAGIISHFAPMTEFTYVIPADVVMRMAYDLIAPDQPADGREFYNGLFLYHSPVAVSVLKGTYAGKEAVSIPAEAPGGGVEVDTPTFQIDPLQSVLNGDPTLMGGGESSGGGGETVALSTDRYARYFMLDRDGHISGLAPFRSLEAEAQDARLWSSPQSQIRMLLGLSPQSRGFDSTLAYQPGIKIGGKKYLTCSGIPVSGLSHFLSLYRLNPELKCEETAESMEIPPILGNRKSRHHGLLTESSIRVLKSLDEVINIFAQIQRDRHSIDGTIPVLPMGELALLIQKGKIPEWKDMDVLSVRNFPAMGGSVSRSWLKRTPQGYQLSMLAPRFGVMDVYFPDKLESFGPLLSRYRGPARAVYRAIGEPIEDAVQLFISIQKSGEEFEIKGALAYRMRPEEIPSAFLLDDRIALGLEVFRTRMLPQETADTLTLSESDIQDQLSYEEISKAALAKAVDEVAQAGSSPELGRKLVDIFDVFSGEVGKKLCPMKRRILEIQLKVSRYEEVLGLPHMIIPESATDLERVNLLEDRVDRITRMLEEARK